MKKINYPIIVAVAGLLIASAGQVKAGDSSSCCNDGIAASPKVRAMIDERCNSMCAAPSHGTVTATTTPHTAFAASPKVQQMRNEKAIAAVQSAPETAGYRATGTDGVTASPKTRAMLDERRSTAEIAPLK